MRLFIAIDFNGLKEDFTKLQDKIDKPLAKLKETSAFHLTLKFLGEVEDDKIDLVKERLKEVKFNPFSLTLDKIGVFPDENYIKVVWVGVTGDVVKELQRNVEDSLKEFGFKKDFEFHPHITLARVKFVKDKEGFVKCLKEIKVEEKTIEVKDFRLVKSTLTSEGPVYEDLGVYC